MRAIFLLTLLFLTGCSSLSFEDERELHRWMVPANIAAGYFGAVGWHEGGHAFTAMALGAEDVNVTAWPTKDDEGHWHLGLATARFPKEPSDLELTLFRTMGPTAMWVGHMGVRGLLRTGHIPRAIQPTLRWFSLFNQIGFYGQAVLGLARAESTDLGKERAWISGVMLAGGLAIDLVDFLTDTPDRYFGVLFGEHFYDNKKEKRFGTIAAPSRDGGFIGFWLRW
jgi:hypothetical protein